MKNLMMVIVVAGVLTAGCGELDESNKVNCKSQGDCLNGYICQGGTCFDLSTQSQTFVERFAAAYCASVSRCCDGNLPQGIGGTEAVCRTEVADVLLQHVFPDGRTLATQEVQANCIASLEALNCMAEPSGSGNAFYFSVAQDVACLPVFEGNVPVGGDCDDLKRCTLEGVCIGGRCIPHVNSGESCTYEAATTYLICPDVYHYCNTEGDQLCHPRGDAGDFCENDNECKSWQCSKAPPPATTGECIYRVFRDVCPEDG